MNCCLALLRPRFIKIFHESVANLHLRRRVTTIREQPPYLLHPQLLEKAIKVQTEYDELSKELSESYDPVKALQQSRIANLIAVVKDYKKLTIELKELEALTDTDDPDLVELRDDALVEIADLKASLGNLTLSIQKLLIPPHAFAAFPCILEFRPGIGGVEASIFAKDLMDMYIAYCNHRRWKCTILGISHTSSITGNGISEGILSIDEPGSYERLRYEGGIHRVQRVPATESKGRVHTSAAAVIVLPQLDNGNEESLDAERSFAPGEVRIDVMRARGAGGQHVNTTDSAVRLTHLPTGIVVAMQDNRSQHKNKAKAFMILRSRLAEQEHEAKVCEERHARTSQVAGTDRSDKIRTYNYSQNRITDHRCNFTMYDLSGCMAGISFDTLLDRIHEWAQTEEIKFLHISP
ncbi:hypothetical protein V1512DRAFT_286735 [Lipomyces arxii]|uniref:uncharacterized protein n=1 Tax=Lipomyces arxii TaxID=56418 RepID=UPI0034CF028D